MEAAGGKIAEVAFVSIRVHSDTPGAVNILRAIRAVLSANGVSIAPAKDVPAQRI